MTLGHAGASLNHHHYAMPFGKVTVASDGDSITAVDLRGAALPGEDAPNAVTNECASQLLEYFSGKRSVFDIPCRPAGSEFQLMVWNEAGKVPYSHTITTKELSESIGRPDAYRQIATALRANPIAVIIPTHRIIPKSVARSTSKYARVMEVLRKLEQSFA